MSPNFKILIVLLELIVVLINQWSCFLVKPLLHHWPFHIVLLPLRINCSYPVFLPLNVTFPGSAITFQGLGLLISTKLYNFIVLLVLNTNLQLWCYQTLHLSTVNFHMIVFENHMFILLWCFHHPFYTKFILFAFICFNAGPICVIFNQIFVLGLIFCW